MADNCSVAGWVGRLRLVGELPTRPTCLTWLTRLLFSPHVLEIHRLLVDAAARRRDVVGEPTGLVHGRRHDAEEIFAVGGRRQPIEPASLPLLTRERGA